LCIFQNQESSYYFSGPSKLFLPFLQKSAKSIAKLSHETISRKSQRKLAKNKSLFHVGQISFGNVIKGWSRVLNGNGRNFLMGLGVHREKIFVWKIEGELANLVKMT
jgi:hypothetical protein